MTKFSRKVQPFYVFIDIFFISIAFFVPYIFKYNSLDDIIFVNINLPNFTEYCFIFILEVVFIVRSFRHKRLYGTDRELSIPREMMRVVTCIFYLGVVIGSIIFFAHYLFFSRFVFIINFLLLTLLLGGFRVVKRLILRKLIREGFRNINILILGTGKVSELIMEEINQQTYLGFNVVGFLDDSQNSYIGNKPVLGRLSDFAEVAKKYFVDEVIIALSAEKKIVADLIEQTRKMNLGVRIVPAYFEEYLTFMDVAYLGIVPMLVYKIK